MKHSAKPLFAGLLMLAALSGGLAPAAASARSAGHPRPHATRTRRSSRTARDHRSKSCHGKRCERNTAVPPATSSPAGEGAPVKDDAQDAAAVIAAVLAEPCANTELTPDAENLSLAKAAVLCLINRERAEHGLSPLVVNQDLERAAEGHVAELISDDYFAHVSPSGETPVDRIRGTGYIPGPSDGYVIGENLAWGTYNLSTPQAIVAAWIASPDHLANILEAHYTETGLGITPAVPASLAEGNPGASYAQEFGVIIR